MRWLILVALLPGMAAAQDRSETLADIRTQLGQLSGLIDGLQAETEASGTAVPPTLQGPVLDRLDALEAELRRLTAETEELAFRIDRVVRDGTARIGDLNFRLTELEGGDLGAVGPARPLGGQEGVPPVAPVTTPAPELAVGERADFDAAEALLETDAAAAAGRFDRFLADYPQSPLAGAAHLGRAKALSATGDTQGAGRAYLEAFTLTEMTDPATASAGLLGLGQSLASLGQTREACIALGQVGARFPDSAAAPAAKAALTDAGCS